MGRVMQALSGEELCEVHVEPDATVFQLKECIQKSLGIAPHNQKLLVGAEELNRKGQMVSAVFPGHSMEVGLVAREYDRQEMQAAWCIEAIWKRRQARDAAREP